MTTTKSKEPVDIESYWPMVQHTFLVSMEHWVWCSKCPLCQCQLFLHAGVPAYLAIFIMQHQGTKICLEGYTTCKEVTMEANKHCKKKNSTRKKAKNKDYISFPQIMTYDKTLKPT